MNTIDQIKYAATGKDIYLCDPDYPEEGIRVMLAHGSDIPDVWLITNVSYREEPNTGLDWYAGITLEADISTADAIPLEKLPEEILQQVYRRMIGKDYAEQTQLYRFTCPECGYYFEESWSCAADEDCPECGHRHISPDGVFDTELKTWQPLIGSTNDQHYVLVVEEDVTPSLNGPYFNDETVIAVAKRHRREGGYEDGLYRLTINWDKKSVETGTFSARELDNDEQDC